MSYIVLLECNHCKKEINRTKVLDKETADKVYFDALTNPMIGWCEDCDSKPSPRLLVFKSEGVVTPKEATSSDTDGSSSQKEK